MTNLGASQPVLDFIIDYKAQYDGLSPTYREIMRGCGLHSTSVVHHHVDKLEHLGILRRHLRLNGLIVVGGQWTPPKGNGRGA